MKKTFAEKIFARAAGHEVKPGDIVIVRPDFCMSTENCAASYRVLEQAGITKVKEPDRIVVIYDHTIPAATAAYATTQKEAREFIRTQGITHAYDMNSYGGICHQIMCQEGYAAPGLIIVGADSHTCTSGAMGAFATGIGRTEIASVWATGQIWMSVPKSMKITVTGSFRPGVSAKDLILKIIGDVGSAGADYLCVEFHGEGISNMSIAERMTLCNMGIEMGAKATVCRPDEKTTAALEGKCKSAESSIIWADEDAVYEKELIYQLEDIVPAVAKPHRVDNYASIEEVEGQEIHQAFLGSCTNARVEDLRLAAQVLKGRHVKVRMIVNPASAKVYDQAIEEGIIQILLRAGCTINPPGCGACFGGSGGCIAKGEVCIATTNRNFKGRMGDADSFIYLASPLTVACSALEGRICDPRRYVKDGDFS